MTGHGRVAALSKGRDTFSAVKTGTQPCLRDFKYVWNESLGEEAWTEIHSDGWVAGSGVWRWVL